MKFYIIVVLANFLLFGCSSGIKDGAQLNLIGKSIDEVKSNYGKPDYSKEINLTDGISLYEYQSSLYDYIPKEKGDFLKVTELMYKKGLKKKSLAIWLVKKENTLQVLDALEWTDDINF